MAPISNRPQRYEICIVKEGDLNIKVDLPDFEGRPEFPVRVILNNRTLTVFTTTNFDAVYKSYDLKFVEI